jgi:predicted nuclease with TOPRIM domain
LAATYSATVDQLEDLRQLVDDINEAMKTVQEEKTALFDDRESIKERLVQVEKDLRDQRKASESLDTISKSAVEERDKIKQTLKISETSDRENQVIKLRWGGI